jgi:hypothetical protein
MAAKKILEGVTCFSLANRATLWLSDSWLAVRPVEESASLASATFRHLQRGSIAGSVNERPADFMEWRLRVSNRCSSGAACA